MAAKNERPRSKKTSKKTSKKLAAEQKLELVEEIANVTTREVLTGRVRVSVRSEDIAETVRADLQSISVEVVRVPIDRPVEGDPPQVRTVGDVTIVPVLEEVLFVEKRLVLKEELHIHRRVEHTTAEQPVLLKRQKAKVERLKP